VDDPEIVERLTSLTGYLDGWQALHGGYDPRGNRLVRWWLSLSYSVARPLAAARVSPDLVTLFALLLAVAALGPASAGGWWLLLAAALVVLSGFLDNVDGAVAVLTGRATPWGAVMDAVTDRVADLLFLVALLLAGAPVVACSLGGALMFLLEYLRARATAAGMTEVGVVTVWERPTRVIVTATFLVAGAVVGDPWPALGGWAWVGLGAVGLVQIAVVVRRRLAH
jgi:CDP-diacylglycerol--glycerol-3-phosphate 3-phosphatidyltransferase